jgi:hypothetical protein
MVLTKVYGIGLFSELHPFIIYTRGFWDYFLVPADAGSFKLGIMNGGDGKKFRLKQIPKVRSQLKVVGSLG